MDNWGLTKIKYYVVFTLELSHSAETFVILTDHILFVFRRLLFENRIVTGCGNVFVNRKVECRQLQVSGGREAYDCWSCDVCDIEECSSAFPIERTGYGNGTAVFDL